VSNFLKKKISNYANKYFELQKENAELRRENAELRRENAELRKQVITLQTICDKYFNLYGPLPTI
jgi:cell division protein FtsB